MNPTYPIIRFRLDVDLWVTCIIPVNHQQTTCPCDPAAVSGASAATACAAGVE